MTLATTTPQVTADTDGSNLAFDFTFKMWQSTVEDEIAVIFNEGEDDEAKETTLAELHRSFASLSQEEQKIAEIFLHDIQRGDVQIDAARTFRDYLTDYKVRAQNEEVQALVGILGIDVEKLNAVMNANATEANLNEYGRFDDLKETIDKQKARAYFESTTGEELSPARVNIKSATLLRRFILEDGFKLEQIDGGELDSVGNEG